MKIAYTFVIGLLHRLHIDFPCLHNFHCFLFFQNRLFWPASTIGNLQPSEDMDDTELSAAKECLETEFDEAHWRRIIRFSIMDAFC